MIEQLNSSPELAALAPSLAGDIVAGAASEEEVKAFSKPCDELEQPPPPRSNC